MTNRTLRTAAKQRGRPFPKGRSGNPGGRPKKTPEVIEVENLCRTHSVAAIERLVHWMRSDEARPSIAASLGILERAWGKPRQPLEHTGKDGAPIAIEERPTVLNASHLEPEERQALRRMLLAVKAGADSTGQE